MKTHVLASFDYHLPPARIAQTPMRPRDASRLLVLHRECGALEHRTFRDATDYLLRGDVLVVNNSKVIPARLIGKKDTGGSVEVLLVRRARRGEWHALLKNFKKSELGKTITIGKNRCVYCVPKAKNSDGTWLVVFSEKGKRLHDRLALHGATPTPPYIAQSSALSAYQTVYARRAGSVAAPTAGFHFTKTLIAKLKKKGVLFCEVTLHVGPGTFLPIRNDDIKKHLMHAEQAELSPAAARTINAARREGRRIIAVGTTSVRVLESFSDSNGRVQAGKRDVNIFIYPPYRFKVVDALITNFHLPKSTLLLLVSAFAGTKLIKACYAEAIKKKYRFYSFGDAMFIC